MRYAGLVLGMLLASPCVLAQYKCKSADGAVAFQQTPCASHEQQERLRKLAPSQAPETAAESSLRSTEAQLNQLKLLESERRLRIREAINMGRPMVGMTRVELDQSLGNPDRINAAQYGASLQDQLIYYRNGRTIYVYTKDGIVTSIQDHGGVIGEKVQKPCPSSREIRDIEIDISKISNRDNQRLQADLHKRLHDAKACR